MGNILTGIYFRDSWGTPIIIIHSPVQPSPAEEVVGGGDAASAATASSGAVLTATTDAGPQQAPYTITVSETLSLAKTLLI